MPPQFMSVRMRYDDTLIVYGDIKSLRETVLSAGNMKDLKLLFAFFIATFESFESVKESEIAQKQRP